jgi:hypothetical protein
VNAYWSEWFKLRRRGHLLGALAAFLATATLGTAATILTVGEREGGRAGPRRFATTVAELASHRGVVRGIENASTLLGAVALVVAAAAFASEYTHGTLRNLLVREPRRLRLLVGKYAAVLTFVVLATALALAWSVALSFLIAPSKSVPTDAWRSSAALGDIGRAVGNLALASVGYATLGAVLGLVLRSSVAAVGIGLAYLLPAEAILSNAWDASSHWLPGQLLSAVAAGGNDTASYSTALWRVAVYSTVAVVVAAVLFRRRDVST